MLQEPIGDHYEKQLLLRSGTLRETIAVPIKSATRTNCCSDRRCPRIYWIGQAV
ncbi:MAG TPA: hypothetical protein IAA29_08340 [Candidatus Paenibacillus intestinavium]|nr:hypothetical protein [Candidatus Paenibacillus intestinavium]